MNLLKIVVFLFIGVLVSCTSVDRPQVQLRETARSLRQTTGGISVYTAQGGSLFTGVLICSKDTVYVLSVAHGLIITPGVAEKTSFVSLPYWIDGKRTFQCETIKCGVDLSKDYDLSLTKVIGLIPAQVKSAHLRSFNPSLNEEIQTIGNPVVPVGQGTSSNNLEWVYSRMYVSSEKIRIVGTDQTAFIAYGQAYPGQSGSGVFDGSGLLVGILSGSFGGPYTSCIGVEEIVAWAKGTEIEPVIAGSILH